MLDIVVKLHVDTEGHGAPDAQYIINVSNVMRYMTTVCKLQVKGHGSLVPRLRLYF